MKKYNTIIALFTIALIAITPITAFATDENAKVNDVALQNNTDTTNMTATAPLSTNGAGVKVNIKTAYKTQIPIGTVKKLKITNQSGNLKVKSSNSKIIRITKNNNLKAQKPGKAIITIKTNGITIKRKVKAVAKLKITYTKKKKLTINVGQNKKIKKLYTYTTNLKALKKYVSSKKYKKFKKQVDKKAENPRATVKNTDLVKVTGKKINAKNKGNTTVKIKCGKQSFDIPVTVTKKSETTFKDKKAKIAYSLNEAYQYIKDAFNNYQIKGNKPQYPYIVIGFEKSVDNIKNELYNKIENDIDSPDNFHSLRHQLSADYEVNKDSNGTKYIDVESYNKRELAELKKLYNTAQDIFKSLNMDSFTEDYEKLIALRYWFKKNCTYGDSYYLYDDNDVGIAWSERGIIHNHIGVCSDYAATTNYFCSLLHIPSIKTDLLAAGMHNWNIVKLGDKWYHIDNLNYMTLFGNKDLYELGDRSSSFKMSKQYFDVWEKRVSDDSIMIYQSKLKEIAEKCGIITDSTGKYKMWVLFGGDNNIICDLE